MKRSFPIGLALAAALLGTPPAFAASMDDIDTMPAEDMQNLRGGTETADTVQVNVSTTTQTNVMGHTVVDGDFTKVNGDIGNATVSGTHGIVTQMINTGDNTIMNAGTNVNIYLK